MLVSIPCLLLITPTFLLIIIIFLHLFSRSFSVPFVELWLIRWTFRLCFRLFFFCWFLFINSRLRFRIITIFNNFFLLDFHRFNRGDTGRCIFFRTYLMLFLGQWFLLATSWFLGVLGVLLVYIILFYCVNHHWLFLLWLFLGNLFRLFGFLAFGIMLTFILFFYSKSLLSFSFFFLLIFLFYSLVHSFSVSITSLPLNLSVLFLCRLLRFHSFLHDGFTWRTSAHDYILRLLIWRDRLFIIDKGCSKRLRFNIRWSFDYELLLLIVFFPLKIRRVFQMFIKV